MNTINNELGRDRFDLIDQEQLAAQMVALMDAHWHRPNADEKKNLLRRAQRQIEAQESFKEVPQASQAA